jgi:cobyrinic acid a,c-diamide synthase
VNEPRVAPRLVIAGLAGDSGKTIVSLAILKALRRHGTTVRAFKKGPDYIDPAWLEWASEQPARNLDTYLMGTGVIGAFTRHAVPDGINVIEGNRGLFDGFDIAGTHSTAELAKLLHAPVLLVLNAAKLTRTAAALVLGCQKFDPELNLEGVVLNRVNGKRHENILRDCIEQSCGIPVVGVVPTMESQELVPARHLGLVTPDEHGYTCALDDKLIERVAPGLNIGALIEIARKAPALPPSIAPNVELPNGSGLKIGLIRDSAFSFYYAENLEALERTGAELVPISALTAEELPSGINAFYIGGGFPETHAERLAANAQFLASLRAAALAGMPIYAECGGLMLLSQAMTWRGTKYPMARVLPFEVEVCARPQGHGYAELLVDSANPFYQIGLNLRGHEFHYSRIIAPDEFPTTACAVKRGTGTWAGRDAVVVGNVWASYTHLHATGTPEWARGMIAAALANK